MPLKDVLNTDNFVVGAAYTRNEVADSGEVDRPNSPRDWTGIVQFRNCTLLFVTLDKTNFDPEIQYHDMFEDNGELFFWDSQNRNSQSTPVIQRMIYGEEIVLFVRLKDKIKSQTQPFIYAGHVTALDYSGNKPVQFSFQVDDYLDNPNNDLRELYEWRPTGPSNKRILQAPIEKERSKAKRKRNLGKGQGRQVDPEVKKVIEMHAMGEALRHYEGLGYTVQDTSANNPFDYLCRKDGNTRRVEVKGTTQDLGTVNVTANEVESARDHDSETDLFILYQIQIDRSDEGYKATGGELKLIENWLPQDDDLKPTAFIYTVI